MKPCKHLTADTNHIFYWHTKISQLIEQDLPESLQAAFEKAMNFEARILMKQTINTRRMNEVNQIDVTNYDEDFEVNEATAPATQQLYITRTTTTMEHQIHQEHTPG